MEAATTLPRTTHMLKHDQHVRLMHFTRKVEALLRETPLFVDSPRAAAFAFPVPPNPINGIKRTKTTRALPRSSTQPPCTAPRSVVPAAGCGRGSAAVRLLFSILLLRLLRPPRTPSDSSLTTADEARRQRTHKMVRVVSTLRENIPTELVFPLPSTSQTQTTGTSTPTRTQTSSGGICRQRLTLGRATSSGRAPISSAARAQPDAAAEDSDSALVLCVALFQTTFISPSNHLIRTWGTRPPRPRRYGPCCPHSFPPSSYSSSYSSPPVPTKYAAYESAPIPAPLKSSSPVRYDRGTPVHDVSYAVFPPVPLSSLAPLSSTPVLPVGYRYDAPFTGTPSSHILRSGSPAPPHMPHVPPSSSYAPSSPHVMFDPGAVGHDRVPPPASSSSAAGETWRVQQRVV
ncbi:hypothetical protein C8R44DRAFT_871666 [Mycena epipterygia]|nr:hypothetical protein C8R44DRAFT_871666 [Mycena epipterygia]